MEMSVVSEDCGQTWLTPTGIVDDEPDRDPGVCVIPTSD